MGLSLKSIFGGGGSKGYVAPDLSFLKDTSGFKYLLDPSQEGYFSGDAETLFNDYLKSVTSPESYGAENDYLKQLYEDIDLQTNQALGGAKSDYLDRGLGGPGQMSDIESIGLAQVRGEGQKLKKNAATQLALDRAKRLSDAYSTRYGAGVSADTQVRGINDSRSQLYANLLNQRDLARASGLTGIAANQAQAYKPGIFEDILRNVRVGVNLGGPGK